MNKLKIILFIFTIIFSFYKSVFSVENTINTWKKINNYSWNNNQIIEKVWDKFKEKINFSSNNSKFVTSIISWSHIIVNQSDPFFLLYQLKTLKNIVETMSENEKIMWYVNKSYWWQFNMTEEKKLWFYRNLNWWFSYLNMPFFLKEIRNIIKLLKLSWNTKKAKLILEFLSENKESIKILLNEWIIFWINSAENMIRDSNNLNPAWNWWYFQVIRWCTKKWSFGKYRLIDTDFSWIINYPFIYRTFYNFWIRWKNKNNWEIAKKNFLNATISCIDEEWFWVMKNLKISEENSIKIWKIIAKINKNDYLLYLNTYGSEKKTYIQLYKELQLWIQMYNALTFILESKHFWITNPITKKRFLYWVPWWKIYWMKDILTNMWVKINNENEIYLDLLRYIKIRNTTWYVLKSSIYTWNNILKMKINWIYNKKMYLNFLFSYYVWIIAWFYNWLWNVKNNFFSNPYSTNLPIYYSTKIYNNKNNSINANIIFGNSEISWNKRSWLWVIFWHFYYLKKIYNDYWWTSVIWYINSTKNSWGKINFPNLKVFQLNN